MSPCATARTASMSSRSATLLTRYPLAPASSRGTRYESSACIVRMSTLPRVCFATSAFVASAPSISPIERSITITSGSSRSASEIASLPFDPSPMTWMSFALPSTALSPARTTAWSSIRITLITPSTLRLPPYPVSPWRRRAYHDPAPYEYVALHPQVRGARAFAPARNWWAHPNPAPRNWHHCPPLRARRHRGGTTMKVSPPSRLRAAPHHEELPARCGIMSSAARPELPARRYQSSAAHRSTNAGVCHRLAPPVPREARCHRLPGGEAISKVF